MTAAATTPVATDTIPINISDLTESEKKDLLAETTTVNTFTTATTVAARTPFNATKSLHISARGVGMLRLPLPSRELQVPIHAADGSTAYVSTRDQFWSGNSVLSAPARGDLVQTEYHIGPGKDPVLRVLGAENGEIKSTSRWTSREQVFDAGFRWVYRKEKNAAGKGKKLTLVMEITPAEEEKGKKDAERPRRIAQLLRDKETRTEGSRTCSAGNGGELMLDEEALKELGIREEVAVATCLLMLKKEIDRRRIVNMMFI